MINLLEHKLPGEVLKSVAQNMIAKRKAQGLTQVQLAEASGVSLGSIKRFERTHQISLASLVNIAFALHCEDDFSQLFSERSYSSIDDVIESSRGAR